MCKICRKRHRLGPCPTSGVKRRDAPGAFAGNRDKAMPPDLPCRNQVEETSVSAGRGVGPITGEGGSDPDEAGNASAQLPQRYGTARLVFHNPDGSVREATAEELAEFVRQSESALRASFEQTADAPKFDKKTYQRQYMKDWRKKRKEAKP